MNDSTLSPNGNSCIELHEDLEDCGVDPLGRLVSANVLLTQYLPELDESPPQLPALTVVRRHIGSLTQRDLADICFIDVDSDAKALNSGRVKSSDAQR